MHNSRKSDVAALREEKYDRSVSVFAKLYKELMQWAGKLLFAHVPVSYDHIILVCACCSCRCSWAWQVQLWEYSFFGTSAFLQWSAHLKSFHLFFLLLTIFTLVSSCPSLFLVSLLEMVTRYFQINLSLFTPCTLRITITVWSLGRLVAVLLPTLQRQRKTLPL